MADDKHYVGGEWYRICDRTGFKIRDTRTRKEWTNRIVRDRSWEPRQPQDFVQGVTDDQTVVDPRPRQLDEFQGPLGTTLTATAQAGATFISVQSSVRMFAGDVLQVMTDLGQYFNTTIVDVLNTNLIQIGTALPYRCTSGNVVIDASAVSNPYVLFPSVNSGGTP
jgi:hypothetical protein